MKPRDKSKRTLIAAVAILAALGMSENAGAFLQNPPALQAPLGAEADFTLRAPGGENGSFQVERAPLPAYPFGKFLRAKRELQVYMQNRRTQRRRLDEHIDQLLTAKYLLTSA